MVDFVAFGCGYSGILGGVSAIRLISSQREVAIRILLVEDNVDLSRRLVEGLQGEGFVVDHAADGNTGCELGVSESFDVAILDLGLPGLQGVEIIKRWRRMGRDMPILILRSEERR